MAFIAPNHCSDHHKNHIRLLSSIKPMVEIQKVSLFHPPGPFVQPPYSLNTSLGAGGQAMDSEGERGGEQFEHRNSPSGITAASTQVICMRYVCMYIYKSVVFYLVMSKSSFSG